MLSMVTYVRTQNAMTVTETGASCMDSVLFTMVGRAANFIHGGAVSVSVVPPN